MKNITINSENTAILNVAVANDQANIREILEMEAVMDFFQVADAAEIVCEFFAFNETEFPEALQDTMLGVVPNDGDSISISLDGQSDGNDNPQEGAARGTVQVYTAGGVQTSLQFEGRMTLAEAIYSDAVQLRSRQSRAQLSACPVVLNGETIEPHQLDTRLVQDGDTIILSPARNAGVKGC